MDPDRQEAEAPVPRRRRSGLLAGVLAVGALGAFSVGAVANGGEDTTSRTTDGGAPALIQDGAQSYGAQGDREDCPERDGSGSGGGGGSQTQPYESAPSPDDVQL